MLSSSSSIASNTIGSDARIHQGDIIHNYATAPREPCVMIPFLRNEELIPRPDIIGELDRILPLSDDYSTAALYGLGGSGKTQIALDYAYRRCQIPSCSVFWVHADNETTFAQDYKSIAKRLDLPSNLDGEDLLMAVRDRIEKSTPWVLILDNADDLRLFGVSHTDAMDLEENALSLEKFIPRGPRGQVLWTSRDERIAGGLVAARRAVKVSNMTPNEAKELFDSVSNNEVSGDEINDIAALLAELDWLPLAISQAAVYIRRTMTTVAEYMTKIKDGKKRWRVLKQSQTDRHRRREVSNSILETWNISMQLLHMENKTAYQILHIHAFLDNQNIPVELIRRAALYGNHSNETDHDHDTLDDASSSDSDSDNDKVTEAIVRLCDFSFLSLQAAGGGHRAYKVHKLVQEAMRYRLGRKEQKREEEVFSAAALEIAFSLFPVPSSGVWNECEKYITHAQQACEWAALCKKEIVASHLLTRVSNYLYQRGRWRVCEFARRKAYELRKATLGERHLDTIASMANVSKVYHVLGKYKEEEEIVVKILSLRRELLGNKHPDTISIMIGVASVNQELRRYEKSEKLTKEVLELQKEILGDRHPNTMLNKTNLALLYHRLGKYKEAEEILLEVLPLQQEILGIKHPNTLWSTEVLGTVFHVTGRFKEAEERKREALVVRRGHFGDDHPDTIRNMVSLATTCHWVGKYEEAEELKVKALALRRQILGNDHPDTIKLESSLAATRKAMKQAEGSEKAVSI